MLDAGMSTEHVARHVGCSSPAIRNLRIRFRTTGSTNDLPLRVTMRGQDRYIMNTDLRDRSQSLSTTAASTPGLHNNLISTQTVRNSLRFTSTTSLRRMRFNATSSSKSSWLGTCTHSLDTATLEYRSFSDESRFSLQRDEWMNECLATPHRKI